jgi:2-(1,2-epoxy-1,2-dihydrophenyl)acetyl-CoA isomerase
MSDATVLKSERAGVATLSLNRPEKLNAFNDEMSHALLDALEGAGGDRAVRAIVLRGEGRGFSAGQDLEAFMGMRSSPEPISVGEHLRTSFNRIVTAIREIEKPVVASLSGASAGVGLSIALACDLRIAADDAKFTLGFSKIGLIPDGGATFMLPLLAGFGRALELAWLSDKIDAREAERLGLVNRVVPAAELADATQAYAERLAGVSPAAVALTKRAFNTSTLSHLRACLENEAVLQDEAASGPDLLEGVMAFMQKRAPAFAAR